MKLFRKRIKGNNKGLSLVELVCAVAIFGVAATAIGSAMVVSAQSYTRGTYELDVQEEAQTATNIVGNLIFDAVSASQSGNVVTINGEGKTYTISYDEDARTLNYEEDPGDYTGVLAENVASFDTSLTPNADDFKADRNVKVEIAIEKNGRTYEATYNTTGRNGSSNAEGVVESAQLIMDSTVVVEPGQKVNGAKLPVTVTGSSVNKDFAVSCSESDIGVTVAPGKDGVIVTAETWAEGSYTFIVKTLASDDSGPLDEKVVTVLIRRITDVDGEKTVNSGTEGKSGSTYTFKFRATGTSLEKVYGREYDMDYVDPKQFTVYYNMVGGDVNNFIDHSTLVEQHNGMEVIVSLKLTQDLPDGAKISVECVADHSEYKNKSSVPYGPISDTQYIETPRFSMGGKLNRGNDDNVENGSSTITIDETFITELNSEYDRIVKIVEMYEATIDADGNFTYNPDTDFAFDLRSDRAGDNVEGGDGFVIRPAHSNRLVPNKAYVMVTRVECYKTGVAGVAWPTADTPKSEYMCEFPISPVTFSYEIHDSNKGIETNYLELKKATSYDYNISCVGLDLSRHQDKIKFEKRRKENASASYGGTEYTNMTCNVQFSGTDGSGKIQLLFQETGYYKITAKLSGYSYYDYSGNSIPATDLSLNDSSDVAVLYIHVTE